MKSTLLVSRRAAFICLPYLFIIYLAVASLAFSIRQLKYDDKTLDFLDKNLKVDMPTYFLWALYLRKWQVGRGPRPTITQGNKPLLKIKEQPGTYTAVKKP